MEHALKKYLREINRRPSPWAKERGLSPALISRILTGKGKVSLINARKIVAATQGQVTYEDLCEVNGGNGENDHG